ncbi:MAG: ATP phosphoribosyltransferase regulatory subunit [Flavobacteriaceae bacterium]|mgnify:CR=1 FL=1|jgi:ATP phosphoribosyltransferase regulatory subunit|nr:ATP phosphoribosyltransferase regulatory subunit [Flavobacteriaceae bacterium]MBT7543614.1 ATP phosphoribosyltransferase regulatory subunit [Gammaproteobacteria bacterium]MBT7604023.1 ATP phosphoribosyltransferase regulatory subunit [Gammaproteobacteria bacterium]
MPITKWILPEGIEDILPEQAYWLEIKRREVIDTFVKFGYGIVIPPLIEYSDSLLTDSSEDLDLQTFKLIDQDTGKQLGLRADITSQISRIYSTYSDQTELNRYCYFDHVIRTKNNESKKSRIPIQAGAELIGFSNINNDAEVVILMLEVLKKFTAKKIFLDLGHVGIFKKLMDSTKLDNEQKLFIKNMIRKKSSSELKNYLDNLKIDESLKKCIGDFPKMHGPINNILKYSDQLISFDKTIKKDIDYIIKLSNLICKFHKDVEIKYDFCELKGFDYENNVIFSAYIENDSEEVAIGGRYDGIQDDVSGIGFSIDVRYLLKYQSASHHSNNLVFKSGKWVFEDKNE